MIGNIRSSYKEYKETSKNPVDVKTYCKIAARYNQFLITKVLKGEQAVLPSRMGTLEILGRKQKFKLVDGKVSNLAPDWVGTKKLWESNPEAKKSKKLLYHMNSHTDGYIYKFFWSKKNVMVENKSLYSLRMTRSNKRLVSDLIMKGTDFKTKK